MHKRGGVMQKAMCKLIGAVACTLLLGACSTDPKSSRGFRLPDGDAATGQVLFVELQCNACHTIPGIELEAAAQAGPVSVVLGGPVPRIKTYGDLVSSVINPSHKLTPYYADGEIVKDGESPMVVYNETMTVQQLIDLVAFLQQQYKVKLPQYTYYSYIY
jgi:mono/diheme cytochrome c family protein